MKISVFIATSLDGYIADKEGNIDWLYSIPNPENEDMGYSEFMSGIDAIVMGRNTFEVVAGFDIEWPYQVPVYVLSSTLTSVPNKLQGIVDVVNGPLKEVLSVLKNKGYHNLYVDGGKTIQSFLAEDLIDVMTITTIPILLGGGIPLFTELPNPLKFSCVMSKVYLDAIVQSRFERVEKFS